MKKSIFFAAAVMALTMTACSSDGNVDNGTFVPVPQEPATLNLTPAQKAKIAFFSNGNTMSEDAVVSWETIQTKDIDRQAEAEFIEAKLPEYNGNLEGLDGDFLFYAEGEDVEIEFYPVYAMSSTVHTLGVFYYDEEGNKHDLDVWTDINKDEDFVATDTSTDPATVWSNGIKIRIKQGYKFGFYWNGGMNTWDAKTTYYSASNLNEEVFCTDGYWNKLPGEPKSKVHAVTFNHDGKTYLGIEDWTDFDFQDMVFMYSKVIKTVPSDEVKPVIPVEPEPAPEPTPDPVEPEVAANGGSVEVNLAVNDEHEQGDWKETHLSVHVRDTTDVTVFLPVEAEYYCPQDDMMIVKDHANYQCNETTETMSMVINGNTVTLNVKYAANGITISTEGVNADVLKYLREKYNDGLTFEIRNYYNDGLTRAELQAKLNNATIEFTNPVETYVNAFGYVDGAEDELACTVKPTDLANREEPVEGVMSVHEKSMLYIYQMK